jgi:hypothetical protein
MEQNCWNIIFAIELLVIIILLIFRGKTRHQNKNDAISVWFLYALIFSFVSFCISIGVLYSNHFVYEGHPDSIVVSSFSILVTLLVGWQIYKTIDVDKKIGEKMSKQDGIINTFEVQIKEDINKKVKEVNDDFTSYESRNKEILDELKLEILDMKNKIKNKSDMENTYKGNYRYLKLHLSGLTPDNIDEFYEKKFNEYVYYHSEKVTINGKEIEPGLKRILLTFPDENGNPNIESLEVGGFTKEGFPITEKMFIESELDKITKRYNEDTKSAFDLDIKAKAELYLNYLKSRLETISKSGHEPSAD